uniref:Uncharacterized protein n=1 Tax=Anguilla anguilla TaxID=7936 RepID=A0A0E9VTH4_ANGAN
MSGDQPVPFGKPWVMVLF